VRVCVCVCVSLSVCVPSMERSHEVYGQRLEGSVCVCWSVCVSECVCTCAWVCLWKCVHVCACMCACMCACGVCVCTFVYINEYVHVYHTFIYMFGYTHTLHIWFAYLICIFWSLADLLLQRSTTDQKYVNKYVTYVHVHSFSPLVRLEPLRLTCLSHVVWSVPHLQRSV